MNDSTTKTESHSDSAHILFVDDEKPILDALRRLCRSKGWKIFTAQSGEQALSLLSKQTIDLIVSDMRMPNMSGAELLSQVSQLYPDIIKILLTGYADMKSTIRAINEGAIYNYVSKPWDNDQLKLTITKALQLKYSEEQRKQLTKLTQEQNEKLSELNETLEKKVKQRTIELSKALSVLKKTHRKLHDAYKASAELFSNLLELREGKNSGHSRRVCEHAMKIADRIELDKQEKEQLYFACLLHDIGKISSSDTIFHTPYDNLSKEERQEYHKHTTEGEAILLTVEPLQSSAKAIRHHHENYNGTGYPDKLFGENIPIASRIIAIASDYDDLLDGKIAPIKMNSQNALQYIKQHANSRYDPNLVVVFEEIIVTNDQQVDEQEEQLLRLDKLEENMIIAEDLFSNAGVLLIPRGFCLTDSVISKIKRFEKDYNGKLLIRVISQKNDESTE